MKWPIYKINDICKVSGGKRLPKGHQFVDSKTKHPYIRITDMSFDSLSTDALLYITEETFKHISRYTISKDDIYISIAGTIGYVGKIPEFIDGANLTENCAKLSEFSDEINMDYLLYYLRSPRGNGELLVRKGGASQPKLALERIKTVPVPVPPINIQSRIANILSAYDDLIQNNKKQIKLLEEAAMRLYTEWFVNMRFPGYENTKIIDGVPEGWEKCNLGLYAKVKSGYAFKSSWWKHNGVPVIKIKDIQDNTVNLSQLDCVDISNANKAIDFKVVAGDLLIAMTGATTGKIAIVPIADDMLVNQRVGKFFLGENPIAKLPFLYSTLQEANSHNWALNFANGSAQPNISPTQIESLEILFSERFVSLYNEKMQPYFESIIKLRRLINRAQQARDKLLPKLMSGEIEV
jgi:type I restriction enzyme S subunit